MLEDFRKFKREIERQGYALDRTKSGHYQVIAPGGLVIANFAVTHGKGAKSGEVLNPYVRIVRKSIRQHKSSSL